MDQDNDANDHNSDNKRRKGLLPDDLLKEAAAQIEQERKERTYRDFEAEEAEEKRDRTIARRSMKEDRKAKSRSMFNVVSLEHTNKQRAEVSESALKFLRGHFYGKRIERMRTDLYLSVRDLVLHRPSPTPPHCIITHTNLTIHFSLK
jgi:hypothetical protein